MGTATIAASAAAAALTGMMRRLARTHAERDRLEAELNSRVEAIKGLYAGRIHALARSSAAIGAALERYCADNRAELMPNASKSCRTAYGRVGFRRSPVQVVLADGLDEGQVCRRLRERQFARLVRVRETPDRSAIRKAMESGEVREALLADCGVRFGGGEEVFFCALDRVGAQNGTGR